MCKYVNFHSSVMNAHRDNTVENELPLTRKKRNARQLNFLGRREKERSVGGLLIREVRQKTLP